ncbi:MAG: histidine kinase, partial [Thermoanaerobaculia bacterium]|nr:histidine kinase [Thermoanaerobaculia bacterium]
MKIPLALVLVISGFIPCLLPAQAPSQRNAPRQTVKPAAFEPPHTFFEHFGAAQGVPGEVTAIVQDHRGYLWCAVKNKGLLRFDGLHFKPYINDPDNPASLPDNDIRDIIEDRNGMLWLATQTGVVRFNPARERFQYVPQRIQDGIWCLQEGSNGRIWVGTARSGLAYYEPRHDSIVPFLFAGMRDGYTGADLSDSFFDCFFYLAQEADGSLWAAATMHDKKDTPGRSALLHIDVVRKAALLYAPGAHLNIQNRWGGDQSNCFFDLKKRMFWIGSLGIGLLQFSVAGREWKQIIDDRALTGNKAENAQILSIQPLNDTIFWLGQSTGLAFLNIANGRYVALEPAPGRPGGSQEGRHKAIYRDRDGTCWFGVSRGLSRLDPYRQQFPVRSPLPPGFDAQAIAEYPPTGELFFASWDTDNFFRIIAWHPKTGKRRRAAQRLPFRANDFPSVHQIFVAPGGRVWVLLNRGIGWLDPNTLRLRFPDLPVANAPGVRTGRLWPRRITADEEGKLWMATFGTGLVRYDPKTGEFRRPPELPVCRDTRREYNLFLFSIFADENGKVFLGENGTGLEVWDKRAQTRFLYESKPNNSHSINGLMVNCIDRDLSGNIWVGTEGGLCRYLPGMPPDSAFERVTGISDEVMQIVTDTRGRLWLSTFKGLYCYDPVRGIAKKFDEKEGMAVEIHAHLPLFKSSDGQIWLGDDLHFHPEKINLFPPAASPMITGFRVYDQAMSLPEPARQAGLRLYTEISLQPDQEVFTIETGLLGFTAPEQTRLLYRLQNDDPWSDTRGERAFTFNRLPGGRYRFALKAIAPDGTDTGLLAELPLRVLPPFYRTTWFWTLCAGVFAALVYAIFRYRELQRLEQEKLRLRIARDLHDEMGSTLSSISILSEAALRNLQQDIDRARFGAIGERARQVMEAMSDIVWSVNPRNDNMANVLRRMKEFAVEILESQGIALHFEADEAVAALNLPMEQRKDFYLLFKEAVNNAAKYSGASGVWVTVRAENGGLTLEVRDNGRGFDVEQVKRGNGLWNMERRAER